MSFDGRLLGGVSVFVAVVETGNFARAGEALGITPSGVSRAIARLESRLRVRLVHRTTRSVALTDDGRRFFERVGTPLAEIETAAADATSTAHSVRGRLRVNIDPFFSRHVLAPRLAELLRRHPELEIELFARDEIGDLVRDGFDIAIRWGDLPDSSWRCRRLLQSRILTAATPAYLERCGRPKSPAELANHSCIHFRDPVSKRAFDWEFQRGRKVLPVKAGGRVLVNDVGTKLNACLAGAGIAQMLALGVEDLFAQGTLVDLFPDWPDETYPLNAFYPTSRQLPAKTRALIDFCLEIVADIGPQPAGPADVRRNRLPTSGHAAGSRRR